VNIANGTWHGTRFTPMAMSLVVNGVRREVVADPATPLLWVLRDDVGDQSPKYGCGAEQCGSCMVLVADRPTFSCRLPVGDVGDRAVTTVAGLADDPAAAAVQRALVAHNAGQCGYCLPGIVVTLTDVVRRGEPLDADGVRRALDDHLCRCGAQPRIVRAALDALGALAETAEAAGERGDGG
jgi:aerobic-type carbon monoxide dehydrogenase small subunit (CoxS/CutS family)